MAQPRPPPKTATRHKGYLLIGDPEVFQHGNLLHDELGKSGRVDRIVAVVEAVFDLSAGETFYNRTAHGELVQVVVSEMLYYLSHDMFCLSIILINASPPSIDGE